VRREDGFSLLEMLVATAVMLTVTAGVFAVMNPSQGTFATEPEVADMQQRLRVATDSVYKDLLMAGAGAYSGTQAGSLGYFFASVLPYRRGIVGDDPPGTFKSDTITIMYVPPTLSQTKITTPMPDVSAEIKVAAEGACPLNGSTGVRDPLCGFEEGMDVLIYDDTGTFDVFTITNVQSDALHLQHNDDPLSKAYGAGAKIVQYASHTYYLKSDDATQTYQLMHYDGSPNPDTPVVDNVVGLNFEYYGEPLPPVVKNPSDASTLWTTTYGPKPPASGVANCLFDAAIPPVSTLAALPGPGLVKLTAAQLTDGPFCPDGVNSNRWDADLLRIRKIAVTLRVQAAAAWLRGPASMLFAHGGTSRGGSKFVPDQEIRFQVTPRNLNLGR
jgi:prepilin-type N-terminal cleavage/methylation domain-containing protein